MKRTTIIIVSIVAVLCAAAATAYFYAFGTSKSPDVRLYLPSGSSADDLRSALTSQCGSFGSRVYTLWKLQGGTAQAAHGSYVVSDGMTALEASRMLLHGRQTPVNLTFNNMRTMGDLAGRIGRVLECDSAQFLEAVDSLLSSEGLTKAQYASAFIPDTYQFYWTDSPARVVDKLFAERSRFWNDERRAKAKSLGLTPEQVHTLASIVEEETNKADEQGTVARLYMNRLKRGIPLQADPTVKFALGDFSLRRIVGEHLKADSPYNTYRNTGLPPGPIRIAERATLQRVLDAPENNYIYMCAKSDFSGYHDFTSDYSRHRINAARYHRALSARGI